MFGFDNRPSQSCRLCGRNQHPEVLTRLEVRYLDVAPDACPACVSDFASAGRRFAPFVPADPPRRGYLWPGPSDADLAACAGTPALAEAVRKHLAARARLSALCAEDPALAIAPDPTRPLSSLVLADPQRAARAFELAPELKGLLISAWEAWDDALPYYELESEVQGRGMVLFSLLNLELGALAPRLYGRKGEADGWLRSLSDQAKQSRRPALEDPRGPLIRALLARERDSLGGVDAELTRAQEWITAHPERASDAARELSYARYLRARERGQWEPAREALRLYCKLSPQDEPAFLELAAAHLQCARPEIAREILASRVGSAGATDAAVAALVRQDLDAIRPALSALHDNVPQGHWARLGYVACLLRVGDGDEAWSASEGSRLLEATRAGEELSPAGLDLAELAAEAAHARGEGSQALELLREVYRVRRAEPTSARAVATRRNLLALLQAEAQEALDELERETRGPAEARAELAKRHKEAQGSERQETWGEIERLDAELSELVLGPLEDELQLRPGLRALHALLGRYEAAIDDELQDPVARGSLSWFLGRELGARFKPSVEPPSRLDRGDLSLADSRMRWSLAFRSIARRQFPAAIEHERLGRESLGFGAPLRALLDYLELVRRGGEAVTRWAVSAWLSASRSTREKTWEVGIISIEDELLESGRTDPFAALLAVGPDRPADLPPLTQIVGRCLLYFPDADGGLRDLPRSPRVRSYLRAAIKAEPRFPLLLDLGPEAGMFRLLFGSLASPDALTDDELGINAGDASVRQWLETVSDSLRAAAKELGLDATRVLAPLLKSCPPELAAELRLRGA